MTYHTESAFTTTTTTTITRMLYIATDEGLDVWDRPWCQWTSQGLVLSGHPRFAPRRVLAQRR